jgi:hypothetical protein
LSPQNGGFIRAFWLVPDSCGKEFRAVAGSARTGANSVCFFQQSLQKQLFRDLKGKKVFYQNTKTNPIINERPLGKKCNLNDIFHGDKGHF